MKSVVSTNAVLPLLTKECTPMKASFSVWIFVLAMVLSFTTASRADSLSITFTGYEGHRVEGLVIDGVVFHYSDDSFFANVDNYVPTTNHISPPAIDLEGDEIVGTLELDLPAPATMFSYGFMIYGTRSGNHVTGASLYRGTAFLKSQWFPGAPDPMFTGGFASIQSDTPFDRVLIDFSITQGAAVDNISIEFATPEPESLLLLGSGVAGLGCLLRRRLLG
jgi:hypothetical protein